MTIAVWNPPKAPNNSYQISSQKESQIPFLMRYLEMVGKHPMQIVGAKESDPCFMSKCDVCEQTTFVKVVKVMSKVYSEKDHLVSAYVCGDACLDTLCLIVTP